MTEEFRETVFHTLLATQKVGLTVSKSREAVARHLGLSEEEVQQIEAEGLAAHGLLPPAAF